MNPLCFVCRNPATKVCKHIQCSSPPFYCSGPCIREISQKMHTHCFQQDFVPLEQFQSHIQHIRSSLHLHEVHKSTLDEIKKKVQLTKDNFNKQAKLLDKAFDQFEKDMHGDLGFKLTEENQSLFDRIEEDANGQLITGSDLGIFLNEQEIFVNQRNIIAAIECVKKDFEDKLLKIQSYNVQNIFMSFNQRILKSNVLLDEAIILKQQQQYKKALKKLKEARKINNFSHQIHFEIGWCEYYLKQLDNAQQSFRQALRISPKNSWIHYNIGVVMQSQEELQEAVQLYSAAIDLDQTDDLYYKSRGHCYFQQQNYKAALDNYSKALELNPGTKQYTNELQKIGTLMNNQTQLDQELLDDEFKKHMLWTLNNKKLSNILF